MINLSDLTIVIPFRYDTEDRIENLRNVIRYFNMYFRGHEFIIYEDGPIQYGSEFSAHSNVYYRFTENRDLLHRTKMLNDGAKQSNRAYVTLYDTDVVFRPEKIASTMELLRQGQSFVFPYNGVFLDISGENKVKFLADLDFSLLPDVPPTNKLKDVVGKQFSNSVTCSGVHYKSCGGATFFNRDVFLICGGYNEQFISWGFEDNEIVSRFVKLGHAPVRTQGNLFHLSHRRGLDSSTGHSKYTSNQALYMKVNSMSKIELINYVNNVLK